MPLRAAAARWSPRPRDERGRDAPPASVRPGRDRPHAARARLRLSGRPGRASSCGRSASGSTPADRSRTAPRCSLVLRGRAQRARCDPGLTIIDSSSGNTAVGLALVGRAKGYAVELVMPDSVSAERRQAVRSVRRRASRSRPRSTDPTARSLEVRAARRRGARALLLRRPVPQPRQPPRALPHDRPRDLGADRRAHHALRRRASARPAPSSAPAATSTSATRACAWSRWSPTSRCTAWRGSSTCRPRSCPRSTTRDVEDEKLPGRDRRRLRALPRGARLGRAAGRPLGGRRAVGRARGRARRASGRRRRRAAARRRRALPGGGREDPARAGRSRCTTHARDAATRSRSAACCSGAARRRRRVDEVVRGREPRDRDAARALPDRTRGPDPHPARGARRGPRDRRLLPQPSRPSGAAVGDRPPHRRRGPLRRRHPHGGRRARAARTRRRRPGSSATRRKRSRRSRSTSI